MSAAPSAPATCAWRRALRIIAPLLVASSSGNHEAPALNPPSPACSYQVKARQRGRPPLETVALVLLTRRSRAFGNRRPVGTLPLGPSTVRRRAGAGGRARAPVARCVSTAGRGLLQ